MRYDTFSRFQSFLRANPPLLLITGHLFAQRNFINSITLIVVCDFLNFLIIRFNKAGEFFML